MDGCMEEWMDSWIQEYTKRKDGQSYTEATTKQQKQRIKARGRLNENEKEMCNKG